MTRMGGHATRVPWWGETLAKFLLSRTPISHQIWVPVGTLLYEFMGETAIAWPTLSRHLKGGRPDFSESMWGSHWFRNCGFFTNRMRRSGSFSTFTRTGSEIAVLMEERWSALSTPLERLNKPIRFLSGNDLSVSGSTCVIHPGVGSR